MNRLRMPCMALVMAISLAAIAQDQPATQPATQPVQPAAPAQANDAVAVRAAARALLTAIDAGDEQGMRENVLAQTPEATRLLEGQIIAAGATARVAGLVQERFGAEQAARIHEPMTPQLDQLDDEHISIDGDKADVALVAGGPAAPFARVDGKWKFDTAEYSRRCNMNVDDEVRQAEAIASAHTTLHKRIEAGEIGTDEQLQEAILDAEEQVNRRIQAAESAP